MFKLRPGGQPGSSSAAQPPTIEAIRRRARHRLIGASVLVLAGVMVFPVLFDTQPRPVSVDIPIDIPAKQTAKPLTMPADVPAAVRVDGLDAHEELVAAVPNAPVGQAVPAAGRPSAPAMASAEATAHQPAPREPHQAAEKAADKAAEKGAERPHDKPQPKAADKPAPKPEPAPSEAARAKAALEGQDASQRLVVQVGAFADSARAQEARQKLERAGLKTYTHVAKTPQGDRIRVRVGPFATRADADKAAAKVKAQGLPAAVLTL